MDAYFEDFKEKMHNRYRIPQKMVDKYEQYICFLFDCDNTHIQVAIFRTTLLKPLGYEVNISDTKDVIEACLNEPFDPKATYFGTYKEAKKRISLEVEIP